MRYSAKMIYLTGIGLLTVVLLIANTFQFSAIKVDQYSILLILLLLIIAVFPEITRIKFGDFELERQITQAEKKVENTKPSIEETKSDSKVSIESRSKASMTRINSLSKELAELYARDKSLALAKLRMELERSIERAHGIHITFSKNKAVRQNMREMLNELKEKYSYIDRNLFSSAIDVITICNQAIHGKDVNEEQGRRILFLGIKVISYLEGLTDAFIDSTQKKFDSTVENLTQK